MTHQPKLIALDLGERRIGMAVNVSTDMVLPAGYIVRGALAQDVQEVISAASERKAVGIVVGVPYNPQGRTNAAVKQARGFIRALRKGIDDRSSLGIYEMNESFTSFEAEALLRDAGVEPSRDRASVDEAAAVLILQRYLISNRR